MDFLCNSHAGITHLVSVLDLDNVIVGLDDHRTPTRMRPITPIISLNDVKCMPRMRVRQDEKAANRFLIVSGMVEPNGFEPMTSCLQSRRSTN